MKIKSAFIIPFTALLLTLAAYSVSAAGYEGYEKFVPDVLTGTNSESDITRGEFCHVIYRLFELRGAAPERTEPPFADTDDYVIGALCGCGVVEGYSETEFAPDDFLTREQAGKIACAAMDYLGMDDKNVVKGSFRDSNEISDWAVDYVNRLGRNYIMQGYGVDTVSVDKSGSTTVKDYSDKPFALEKSNFAPRDNFTRGQSVIVAKRIYTRAPVYSDNTYSWDLGDGMTFYENADTMWTEKDGRVAFCLDTPEKNIKSYYGSEYFEKPETGKMLDGDMTLAVGKELYNISTGELIAAFDSNITRVTPLAIIVKKVQQVMGFTSDVYETVYDYDMNTVGGRLRESSSNLLKTMTDSEGKIHHIYCNTDGNMTFSKADSLEAAFTYDYPKTTNSEYSNISYKDGCDIVRNYSRANGEIYDYMIYRVDGELLYEGADSADAFSSESYYVEREDKTEIYDSDTNELILTFPGRIKGESGEYVTIIGENTQSLYKKSGELVLDGIKSTWNIRDDSFNTKYIAYILEDKTLILSYGGYEPITEIQGSNISLYDFNGEEYFNSIYNGKGRLYTAGGELLLESNAPTVAPTDTGYIAYTVQKNDTGTENPLIVMYNKSGNETQRLDKRLKKRSGCFFTTDDSYLYNTANGHGVPLLYENVISLQSSGDTVLVTFGDNSETKAAVYSSALDLVRELDFTGNIYGRAGNYLIVYCNSPSSRSVYDIRTGERVYNMVSTGSNETKDKIFNQTVGDKTYICVYSGGKTGFYDSEEFSLRFELDGTVINTGSTPDGYIITKISDNDGGYLYDSDGNFIKKMKNPEDYGT